MPWRQNWPVKTAWATVNPNLLRLFSIAFGKHLMRFICAQPNFDTRIELASAYCYRVRDTATPDMLSVVFRCRPRPVVVLKPGEEIPAPQIEFQQATKVVRRAAQMADLDDELRKNSDTLKAAVAGSESLLKETGYDLEAYRQWLAKHPIRPVSVAA